MALWQGKSNRKPTGGRLVANQGKRKFEIGREKQFTRIGEQSLKQYRGAGGSVKVGMLSAQYANVVDKKTNTVKKVKILTVKSNPAHHYRDRRRHRHVQAWTGWRHQCCSA